METDASSVLQAGIPRAIGRRLGLGGLAGLVIGGFVLAVLIAAYASGGRAGAGAVERTRPPG